jgi:hypothetical protein
MSRSLLSTALKKRSSPTSLSMPSSRYLTLRMTLQPEEREGRTGAGRRERAVSLRETPPNGNADLRDESADTSMIKVDSTISSQYLIGVKV